MTTLRSILFSGFVLGAVSGCTDSSGETINYQLSGGFGAVHATVHIDPSGKMTRVKLDGTTEITQLDAAALADLEQKVDDAEFPTLEPMYPCGCADDFVHTISVHVRGSTYIVTADGSADYPDRLRPLIATLSTIAQAALTGN